MLDEVFGKVHAPGRRDRLRRGAEVFVKQAAQVSVADSKTIRKRLDPGVIEGPVCDQSKRTRHRG